MARINEHYEELQAGYLFPEIAHRTNEFMAENPDAEIYKLGIGDTTLPLTPRVTIALHSAVHDLSIPELYTGYGAEQGNATLRQGIADHYVKLGVNLQPNEVFVSDGAKPDSANIQSIFAPDSVVAVQDPTYPVYVDTAVIGGKTSGYEDGRYKGIVYMDCTEENGFFPDVPDENVDLIYLCSPNNPTGAVATKEQLQRIVDYANEHGAAIIYDAAYSAFISDDALPRSIYEVEGAKECAIEINSFSKIAGFTGVRLGWTIVSDELQIEDTKPGEVQALWNRRQTTMFNGASNIAQMGGIAALGERGQEESQKLVDYYMENAEVIRGAIKGLGMIAYGGVNAPYVWVKTPNGMGSWEFFDKLLNETHVVSTPGAGFGRMGEGYFRLSAFGDHNRIKQAVSSIKDSLKV